MLKKTVHCYLFLQRVQLTARCCFIPTNRVVKAKTRQQNLCYFLVNTNGGVQWRLRSPWQLADLQLQHRGHSDNESRVTVWHYPGSWHVPLLEFNLRKQNVILADVSQLLIR